MNIDDVLEAAKLATPGEWEVDTSEDDSGDRIYYTYRIVAIMPWGPKRIGYAEDDPHNAILFAGSRLLVEEVKRLRAEILGLKGERGLPEPRDDFDDGAPL